MLFLNKSFRKIKDLKIHNLSLVGILSVFKKANARKKENDPQYNQCPWAHANIHAAKGTEHTDYQTNSSCYGQNKT